MPPPAPPRPPVDDDAGQASVEFVALLPLILALLVLAWQMVLVGHAAWSAHAAARAAARAHAVGGDALQAARRSLPAELDDRVRVAEDERDAEVAVRLRVPMVVPGLGRPTITARSSFADQS